MRIFAGGLVLALASVFAGCAVHSQAPIKEVAYDFSDYGSYDRPFGTSPSYPAQSEETADQKAKTADEMVAFPCNKQLEGDEEVTCYFHHKRGKGGPTESDVRIETDGDTTASAATNTRPASPQPAPPTAPAPPAVQAPVPASAPNVATR